MQSILHLCELCDFPCICSTFLYENSLHILHTDRILLFSHICFPLWVDCKRNGIFVVRTQQITVFIYAEIHCSVWIIMVFNILAFFFIHGKFHVFSHSVFFTVQIVVEAPIACVGNWIFRILSIYSVEFFHKRLEAIHIRGILLYVIYGDILIANAKLYVVTWEQLIVSHIVFFIRINVASWSVLE